MRGRSDPRARLRALSVRSASRASAQATAHKLAEARVRKDKDRAAKAEGKEVVKAGAVRKGAVKVDEESAVRNVAVEIVAASKARQKSTSRS